MSMSDIFLTCKCCNYLVLICIHVPLTTLFQIDTMKTNFIQFYQETTCDCLVVLLEINIAQIFVWYSSQVSILRIFCQCNDFFKSTGLCFDAFLNILLVTLSPLLFCLL